MGDVGESPGESCLFSSTPFGPTLESACTATGVGRAGKRDSFFAPVRACALDGPCECQLDPKMFLFLQ